MADDATRSPPLGAQSDHYRIRLSILSAERLMKRDLFRLPDPLSRISVDGTGQYYSTHAVKGTLDPNWNKHYDLYLTRDDSITISVWNERKLQKKRREGFLGMVRLMGQLILQICDKGHKKLHLIKGNTEYTESVRGTIVINIVSRVHVTRHNAHTPYPRLSMLAEPGIVTANPDVQRPRSRSVGSENPETVQEPQSDSYYSLYRRHRNYMKRSELHKMIQLPSGYEQRTTSEGQVYYLHKETGVSTWYDPRLPRDLSNLNETELGGLPAGWELRHTPSGRPYFVNHCERLTQFTDPRIPIALSQGKNIFKRKKEDNAPLYSRDLVAKLKVLRQEIGHLQPSSGHCQIKVDRDDMLESSYRAIIKIKLKDLRRKLFVKFSSEEGLDYGGLAREWFYLLSHEMLNPQYGLFEYSRDDVYTLQINPNSSVNPEHLSYFYFVGRILGMALTHGHYLDGGFTLPLYKLLLDKTVTLDDLESVDPALHRSLVWIKENDITDVLFHTFCVEHESFGEMASNELKPNGANVAVNQTNKHEYVRLYAHWRLLQGIQEQFAALRRGFNELVPVQLLTSLDERELELVLSGLGKIDVDDWRKHTRYRHCLATDLVVQWFWTCVSMFDDEKRARLLQFVTGSSRVPLQGFKALQGSTNSRPQGSRPFTIHIIETLSTNSLPRAHTCFNRIDLPQYESYEKLAEKLTCAVEETCGFSVE